MAEIINETGRSQGGKRKRLSTRVDLTPMVDLGFLLITFFIFTTSMSQPTGLNIVVPAKGAPTDVAEHKTLNLVLAEHNNVYFYIGKDMGNQGCTDFSPAGVRSVIESMQRQVAKNFGSSDEIVILIRPTEQSSYMNLVDILDEIHITGVKKYALMDPPGKEILQPQNRKRPC